jgi:hypothetical protein
MIVEYLGDMHQELGILTNANPMIGMNLINKSLEHLTCYSDITKENGITVMI